MNEADKSKVKAAAHELLQKLQAADTRKTILTTDWYKNVSLQGQVKKLVGEVLDRGLPVSYSDTVLKEKQNAGYQHAYRLAAQGRGYWA